MNRHGIWIWENNAQKNDEYADFTEAFTLEKEGAPVSLRISADSNYAVFVNGTLAAFGQYGDFHHCKVADTHDLTPFCKIGKNEVLITVWFMGVSSSCYRRGLPGLFFEISSNDTMLAVSGEHTLCRLNPYYVPYREKIITGEIGISFFYNAAGAETEYHPAVATGYAPELHERPVHTLTLEPRRTGVRVGGNGETKFILDLGMEEVGFLDLSFESDCEQTVTVCFSEHLWEGEVRRFIGGRDFSVEYGARIGENTYMNPFRRLGCRYLSVQSEQPIRLHYAGLCPTMYPVTEIPFDAGSPLRQRIYEVSKRTLRLCMHEHYEDGPWREQSLWAMDSRNQMLCGYYAFGETRFPRASLWLFGQDTREDGFLSSCAPCRDEPPLPSFGLHWYQAILEYTEYANDTSLVKEIWGKMNSVLDAYLQYFDHGRCLLRRMPDGKYWNFYEWAGSILMGGSALNQYGDVDLILNCLLLRVIDTMTYLSEKVSLPFAHAHLSAPLRASIRKTFRRPFGLYETAVGSNHFCGLGNSLAILTGVADDADTAVICRVLTGTETDLPIRYAVLDDTYVTKIEEAIGDTEGVIPFVPSTLSMVAFTYDALLKTDREKYREYVLNDIDETYQAMLDAGATTFWETKTGAKAFHTAGSLCHGWSTLSVYYYHTLL